MVLFIQEILYDQSVLKVTPSNYALLSVCILPKNKPKLQCFSGVVLELSIKSHGLHQQMDFVNSSCHGIVDVIFSTFVIFE